MRPAEVVIGLDVGTTAVKAVAFGVGSAWRCSAVREYPLLQPRPGWQIQDADLVVAATVEALRECVAVAGVPVAAVSVGTAMHGLLALDDECRPITPLITWADSRASSEASELRVTSVAVDLHQVTGTPVHPMSPLTKLRWAARHDPGTCRRARWWIGLKDYVLLCLTGTLMTELSSASATGMLDLRAGDWYGPALELAAVHRWQLPDVRPTTTVLGTTPETMSSTGLPTGTPVVAGAADGPLGNLGTGAVAPGEAGLNLGTSGAVRMVVDRPLTDPDGRTFCYALTDELWVVGGAISNGAHVVRWAADGLAPDVATTAGTSGSDEALLGMAAEAPPGSDGLVMLPYLVAERAPLWDPQLPGAYLGLRRDHTRAHLIRAAVEGVALQLAAVVDLVDRLEPVTTVRATGGAFRAPLWRTVVAAALDRPVTFTSDAEGGALGAAALGLFALGRVERLVDAAALLTGPSAWEGATVVAPPEHVQVFQRLRERLPGLANGVAAAAGALAGDRSGDLTAPAFTVS
ncbi:sugar kinase [Modestobacter roseus]|nr:sugar kinase [Modestobacter roseus]